ncbi:chaperone NapD [Modicisalibacter luteus]|uniref:Chaperone NapD n=1 Tax=Modicisalibacter luteus TaxID=453962 RepID=A0ABV7M561_9GAMM|nr:chaperone NapD [Halomonas lutea]GHB13445.1 hypothetical protein GCM10007159_39730 [Halomonas lutea]
MDEKVHISSLVVQLQPERLEEICAWCNVLDKAEVHATDPKGVLILVLEASGQREIMGVIDRIREVPGVLAVRLLASLRLLRWQLWHCTGRPDLLCLGAGWRPAW